MHIHVAHVGIALGGGVAAHADGVAEVVGDEPGHHRVQVDDAHALTGLGVEENVVQLGVVVGDPQREHPGLQLAHQRVRFAREGQHRVNLRLHVLRPTGLILGDGVLQLL